MALPLHRRLSWRIGLACWLVGLFAIALGEVLVPRGLSFLVLLALLPLGWGLGEIVACSITRPVERVAKSLHGMTQASLPTRARTALPLGESGWLGDTFRQLAIQLERHVREVMTRHPKTIGPDRLAAEALRVLR